MTAKRGSRWLALLALVLLALAALWFVSRPAPLEVSVATVGRGEVVSAVANTRVGTLKACRRARMSPSAAGQVALIYVKEGAPVQAGAPLLEIWNDDRNAELALAEAEAISARARQEEACTRAEGARREARRTTRLRADRMVSAETADDAETSARSAEAACAAAKANVAVAQAKAKVAESAIARTVLRAPFSGVVAEIEAKLGEFLTPSPPGIPTKPAVDLIDPDCLYVSAPIDEVDAPKVRTGMNVCVTFDAFPEKRQCNARVRRVAPYVSATEKQARTVEVEVDLPVEHGGEEGHYLPGYSADIEVQIARRAHVLRIPTEALIDGRQVLVLPPGGGTLEGREVQVGLSNWRFAEIEKGLSEGERVVTSTGRVGVAAGARAVEEGTGASS